MDDQYAKESTGVIRLAPKYTDSESIKKKKVNKGKVKTTVQLRHLPAQPQINEEQKLDDQYQQAQIENLDEIARRLYGHSPQTRDLALEIQEQYLKVTEEIKLL